jgi:hypothetical protein
MIGGRHVSDLGAIASRIEAQHRTISRSIRKMVEARC